MSTLTAVLAIYAAVVSTIASFGGFFWEWRKWRRDHRPVIDFDVLASPGRITIIAQNCSPFPIRINDAGFLLQDDSGILFSMHREGEPPLDTLVAPQDEARFEAPADLFLECVDFRFPFRAYVTLPAGRTIKSRRETLGPYVRDLLEGRVLKMTLPPRKIIVFRGGPVRRWFGRQLYRLTGDRVIRTLPSDDALPERREQVHEQEDDKRPG